MDCGRRRRNNRRNNRQFVPCEASCEEPACQKSGGYLSGLCSFLILSALMAIIYLMLEHHCTICKAKCDMTCVVKNIEELTKSFLNLKNGYNDLEMQVSKFSKELPRLTGQLEILETLASTLENSEFGWNPKTQTNLPNVDVYLAKMGCNGKNVSRLVKSVAYTDDLRNMCPNKKCLV